MPAYIRLFIVGLFLTTASAFALAPSTAALALGWQSVVLIKVPGPDADGDIVDGLCNATLVNARTLITAAHCFLRRPVLKGGTFKIEIGEYKLIEQNGQQVSLGYRTKLRFEKTARVSFLPGVNPNGSTVSPDLDIAVVHLPSDLTLPANFIFSEMWTTALPKLDATSKVTIVSINPIEMITSNDTKQMAQLNSFQQKGYQIESRSTSRVAAGDSGAPVFAVIKGKTYLIGVVKGAASTPFSNWDVLVTLQGRLPLQ
jgi:hypothetical protein